MTRSVPLSLRISEDKARRIEALAKATDRPKSWLLEQALDAYLESQAWQVARIERGLSEVRRGQAVAHGAVAEWLAGWGGDREGEPPG
ncbi:MAG: ribbon-helix-helix protein, CopG family [Proteobacteria bacterium]|nr:ribbon-helix-helix protein, CopG family [Pseudomonadota bacterium]